MAMPCYLQTGQVRCYDAAGREISCAGSGQDAEFQKGIPWPEERFAVKTAVVLDRLTGLIWNRNANPAGFPLPWGEALDFVEAMNGERALGVTDWRLPNRRELRSLLSHQTRKPALSDGHPFTNVFPGWYWTSTSAAINPAYAWYVHMEGGRMFYGRKDEYHLLWPVRGESSVLPVTGQRRCFDAEGREVGCGGQEMPAVFRGQDGEIESGCPWPVPRFDVQGETAIDRLTGLRWMRKADLAGRGVAWPDAFKAVDSLNKVGLGGSSQWRLPNINELESLVDCSAHGPALPSGHPFGEVQEVYWSSTTSVFEPDWAWALYLRKGAVGVGHKEAGHFHVWPVCDLP